MKPIYFASALLFATSVLCFAEGPSLSVYQILRGPSLAGGELILKLTNPPGRTYYIFGLTIADVPYVIEIKKAGQWVPSLNPTALAERHLRPFLPDSYLVFDVPILEEDQDTIFRVRVFLHTAPEEAAPPLRPVQDSVVELVSGQFSTKTFRPLKDSPGALPGDLRIQKQ